MGAKSERSSGKGSGGGARPHLRDFTTLSFDCYGTLIDWERGLLAELKPLIARHSVERDDNKLLAEFGAAQTRCEVETPAKLYSELLGDVIRRLAAAWSIKLTEDEAASFGASVGRWPAFPDSSEALRYLKGHYRLVVISNVDRSSFAQSEKRLGVTFDRVVTAQDVGAYKPSPRVFEYALADIKSSLGVEKADLLHTAQSLFHDVVPAKALGLRTMWVNRRKGKEGWGATPPPAVTGGAARPDYEVAGLAELAERHRAEASGSAGD